MKKRWTQSNAKIAWDGDLKILIHFFKRSAAAQCHFYLFIVTSSCIQNIPFPVRAKKVGGAGSLRKRCLV
jgi:hypothetical protein